MLDEREHPARHETGGTYRTAAPGRLGDLHDAAAMTDLDPPAGPCRRHLVVQGRASGVDHDLYPVAFHT